MRNRLLQVIGAGLLSVVSPYGMARAAESAVTVPSELKPPDGNELLFKAQATGTQNYICMPSGSAMAWTFIGPQATLFTTIKLGNFELKWQIATHFLSPNAAEGGTARPTWQSSLDTSAVWARAIASSNDPAVVAPGAIPWLLLQTAGTRTGLDGSAGLSQVTYIQRLNTSGGVAPATGCSIASDLGHTAFVPYGAEYSFYKSARSGH
ncbi:MAG TPA: DUF3455 domain-containing protein [Bryobacteraceae bacterium]|jgi:hypothetical protein